MLTPAWWKLFHKVLLFWPSLDFSGILSQLLLSKSLNHSATSWEVKVICSHLGLPLIILVFINSPSIPTSLLLSPTQLEGLPQPTSLPQPPQEFSPYLVLHHRGYFWWGKKPTKKNPKTTPLPKQTKNPAKKNTKKDPHQTNSYRQVVAKTNFPV